MVEVKKILKANFMSYPGMDPSLINFVREMSPKKGEMPYEGKPVEFRKKMAEKSAKLQLKRPENLTVEEHLFDTPFGLVNSRVYAPKNIKKPGPGLMYMHGGGWIIGDLNSHDAVCVDLAISAEIIVISVDYALAPENKFPVALNQCSWIFSNIYKEADTFRINPKFLSIGGDSAGGNLALAVSLVLRRDSLPLPYSQLLIYPCISTDFDSPSYDAHAHAPFLDKKSMIWIWETYLLEEEDYSNPLAFPLLEENFLGLPQTIILNAELDPLSHEGSLLAKKLIESRVPTYHFEAKALIHGFIRCRNESKLADSVFLDICQSVKAIHSAIQRP